MVTRVVIRMRGVRVLLRVFRRKKMKISLSLLLIRGW